MCKYFQVSSTYLWPLQIKGRHVNYSALESGFNCFYCSLWKPPHFKSENTSSPAKCQKTIFIYYEHKKSSRKRSGIQSSFKHKKNLCKQRHFKGMCWVRLGSSTWNVLWFWNNKERRLRLLEKNNWREQLRSLPTNSRIAKRSWKLNND